MGKVKGPSTLYNLIEADPKEGAFLAFCICSKEKAWYAIPVTYGPLAIRGPARVK